MSALEKMVGQAFQLDSIEQQKAIEFIQIHKEKHKLGDEFPKGAAIGGKFTFLFTPTGLGVFITVKCRCGDNQLLTNVEAL